MHLKSAGGNSLRVQVPSAAPAAQPPRARPTWAGRKSGPFPLCESLVPAWGQGHLKSLRYMQARLPRPTLPGQDFHPALFLFRDKTKGTDNTSVPCFLIHLWPRSHPAICYLGMPIYGLRSYRFSGFVAAPLPAGNSSRPLSRLSIRSVQPDGVCRLPEVLPPPGCGTWCWHWGVQIRWRFRRSRTDGGQSQSPD